QHRGWRVTRSRHPRGSTFSCRSLVLEGVLHPRRGTVMRLCTTLVTRSVYTPIGRTLSSNECGTLDGLSQANEVTQVTLMVGYRCIGARGHADNVKICHKRHCTTQRSAFECDP